MSANYVIPFGRKYKGRKLGEIPRSEVDNYVQWLEQSEIKPGSPMEKYLKELKQAISALDGSAAPVPEPEKLGPKGRKPNTNKNDPYRGSNVNGNVARVYFTPGGQELPLINFKGKEYLEVKYRLVWFREERPMWSIETEYVSITDKSAHAKATVKDETGRVITTSHKYENAQGFADFIEKAETGAIGRALALMGYGTQFCADELDEGERIVDAPVGHSHPSEPDVPSVEKGTVISVKLPKRNKADEDLLRKNGFTFDWVNHCYLRYASDDFEPNSLGFEYEIWEKPAYSE